MREAALFVGATALQSRWGCRNNALKKGLTVKLAGKKQEKGLRVDGNKKYIERVCERIVD